MELSNKKSRNILPNVRTNSKGLAFSQKDSPAQKWRSYQNGFFKQNGLDLTVDQNKIHGNIHMRRSRLDGGFYKEDIEKNRDIDQQNLDEVSKDHNIIIDTLAKRQSTFTKGDIESLVLKCTVADKDKYQEVLDKVYSAERLINLGYSAYGKETFTTKENYRKDIQLIELSNDLVGRRSMAINTNNIDSISAKYTLFGEQKNALKHIAHMGNLSCVVGYAGAGKSHTLKAVNELYIDKGYKVYGASISGKVAQALQSDTNIESRTIASLLLSYNNQSQNLPDKGSVLVIDEAGMVGLDDMVDLMKLSKERDLKLVLVGDPNQLEAIGKGSPFRYILDDVGFVPMKDVIRQKDELDRKATVNLAEGKVGLAINHYNAKNNIHIKQDYEVLDSLVGKYSEYVKQDKVNDTLVLSYTNLSSIII
ncbi:AAA family ATPase [Francisella philomiragia]|uniref:AAA family ATPase n=1 Tax=Francisella philomiragia TaxID=28110 RepID=UPI0035124142